MKTERLYYDYASAVPFEANITEVRTLNDGKSASAAAQRASAALILDKTIFYPEGGGQGADRGSINGFPLLDVLEKDREILHIVNPGAGMPEPGPATLVLDAARRRDFMAQHTGQHLLSGIILRITGKPTVSFHLGEEIDTIDVDTGEFSAQTLVEIEEAAADAIEADCPVIIHLCPPEDVCSFPLRKVPPAGEEVIRVVEIQGNDFSPCCGTHCKSTGQINMLRILGAEKYKSMTRISFIAGRRVLRDSRALRENAGIVSRSLSVPVMETGNGVLAFIEKAHVLEQRYNDLAEAAAEIKAKALLDKNQNNAVLIECFENEDMEEVMRIGRAVQKLTDAILVLASMRDLKFAAVCAAAGQDVRPIVKEAFQKAGGKGGGGANSFKGIFASEKDLLAFISMVRANCSVQEQGPQAP